VAGVSAPAYIKLPSVASILASPRRSVGSRWTAGWLCLALIVVGGGRGVAQRAEASALFARGVTWAQFLEKATAQRERWRSVTASAVVPAPVVEGFRRAGADLRILAVAEDWCPDSVNTLPYVARLAAAVPIPFRIIDRNQGEPVMRNHRTPDGRTATPTIVLLRGDAEIGAFVERPVIVQRWFLSMADSPENAKRFGDRQSWYDADRGQSLLAELAAIAEPSSGIK